MPNSSSQKRFCIENNVTCWSFLMCELQGPVYTTFLNFIDISVMVWVQCQILNYTATTAPPSGRLVSPSLNALRRALAMIISNLVSIRPTDVEI